MVNPFVFSIKSTWYSAEKMSCRLTFSNVYCLSDLVEKLTWEKVSIRITFFYIFKILKRNEVTDFFF